MTDHVTDDAALRAEAGDELRAEVEAELAAERASRRLAPARITGIVLLIGSTIAWLAALTLLVEKMHLIADPGASLSCDINPFISCGSVMMTWQASAFGFPNMALGLGGFAIVGAIGALLVARAALPAWFRWATLGGLAFGFAFVHFLAISAIFVIGALCPWCMIVWAMMAPMFFAYLAHGVEEGWIRVPSAVRTVLRQWIMLTVCWYALVALTILIAFWAEWMTMAGV